MTIWRPLLTTVAKSRKLCKTSRTAGYTYFLLQAMADDYANTIGEAVELHNELYGQRNVLNAAGGVDLATFTAELAELEARRLIRFYEVGGERYIHLWHGYRCTRGTHGVRKHDVPGMPDELLAEEAADPTHVPTGERARVEKIQKSRQNAPKRPRATTTRTPRAPVESLREREDREAAELNARGKAHADAVAGSVGGGTGGADASGPGPAGLGG
jgi:hypothetical protein